MYANKINVATVAEWAQKYGYHLSEGEILVTDLPNVHLNHRSSWTGYERRWLETSRRGGIQALNKTHSIQV